ncbi:hypothetical protein Tco_1326969 [Tanacetum coccineum]
MVWTALLHNKLHKNHKASSSALYLNLVDSSIHDVQTWSSNDESTMVGDLIDKGVASIVTSSPSSGTISKYFLSSSDSLSSSTFCFLELSYSSSSPALFELLSCAISASAFFELSSTSNSVSAFLKLSSINSARKRDLKGGFVGVSPGLSHDGCDDDGLGGGLGWQRGGGDEEREMVVRVYNGGDGDDDGASAVGWPEAVVAMMTRWRW